MKEIKANIGDALLKVLSLNGVVAGGGEGRRLFACGAVSVDGEVIRDAKFTLPAGRFSVAVGRNKNVKILVGGGE